MPNLRIFCNAEFNDSVLKILRDGIAPHELVFPQRSGESILKVAPADPAIFQADIAFGQPDIESVLKAERLRWLQLTSAGFTRYDTPEFRAAVTARGLVVTNSSSVFAEACAEHVFSFMLAQARQLPMALSSRWVGGWDRTSQMRRASTCLEGRRVVILGFGSIGTRLVELLAPLRMQIIAMRRRPRGDEGVPTVTPEALARALAEADHVINILPDNAASTRFISKERLGQIKRGAVFYNIGRGTTVDQDALVASLHGGHLAAAWLDVTDPEPLPEDHPLWTAPHCFITPHTAGGHRNESETLVRRFLENFQRFVSGSPLRDRIM
ncbi:MAG: D-2-hydroxyacid dehydrogenase [Methylacidiphilales bacterium]|nr:D-2-hydroxyacid dehydrogenase [Candidatus Methylacidiphilales bacterium]